ncbi:MAG: dihydroorotase, partial [Verrucomicrobia bacterium]|nr:dihydroorotase [Verrucomicrobiota bacterium]
MRDLTIRGGHVIDPASGRNETADIFVVDGRISAEPPPEDAPVISASGLVVAPGLIDMHVHFR